MTIRAIAVAITLVLLQSRAATAAELSQAAIDIVIQQLNFMRVLTANCGSQAAEGYRSIVVMIFAAHGYDRDDLERAIASQYDLEKQMTGNECNPEWVESQFIPLPFEASRNTT